MDLSVLRINCVFSVQISLCLSTWESMGGICARLDYYACIYRKTFSTIALQAIACFISETALDRQGTGAEYQAKKSHL